jgi:MerR family redox-sensitive transcriptional activator SoxR
VAELLTIGEVARRSGVAASALRYYEDRGLITSERTGAAHRRYPRAIIRRVAFIVFAQRVGLTLEEIGEELAKLPTERVPGRRDWAQLSGTWQGRIDDRIEELQRLRDGMTECIGCGCLSLDKCAYVNPDDRLANRGPGPAAWTRRR